MECGYEAPSTASGLDASAAASSAIAQEVVNSAKIRFPEGPLPLDNRLVHLETFLPPSGESFINASFADLYSRQNGAVIAQAPLPETCRDFWTMVWDKGAGVIVCLNAVDETGCDAGSDGYTIFFIRTFL